MKTEVRIQRGPKEIDVFNGEILAETDTHLFVQHGTNKEGGEWFARESRIVNCIMKNNNHHE